MLNPTTPGRSLPVAAALWLLCLTLPGRGADTDVIINEIMYHPPLERDELQYVELFNRGQAGVDLSGWSFDKGLKFSFPEKARLDPNAYLVVCRNAAVFAKYYGSNILAVGNFTGKLSHKGEKIELLNAGGRVVDTVKYGDHDPWPKGPDGHSASLERICPFASGEEPANWAGSALPVLKKPAGTPGRKNDSFSPKLPPVISKVTFAQPAPQQKATIRAEVGDSDAVKAVVLVWHVAKSGSEARDAEVVMERVDGDEHKGTYQATLEGKPAGTLVRFRLKAINAAGAIRFDPSPNDLRPTYSYAVVPGTNTARIACAYVLNVGAPQQEMRVRGWNNRGPSRGRTSPTRGNAAFIYIPPKGGEVLTYDYVTVRPRGGGFKVHFPKDQTFKGMTGINVIFESSPRWVLSEPLAYDLYHLAGVPAPLTEHLRVWVDGRLIGYQLLIEQPNKAFLDRNKRDSTGSLYKANWFGQGLVGQHEKKTRLTSGHEDLLALYNGLTRKSGAEQWEFIRQNFNVDEFVNYYAVNMCIQNWDGFFNNHYLYHDSAGTGRWEVYPWDEDKTWGDYDGASPDYNWYEMPLTFGMSTGRGGHGMNFGFGGWWRPPGWFSGPLLANPEFRKAFLARLNEICNTVFTEEKMLPYINLLEKRLEPEIPIRARLTGEDPTEALQRLHSDIQSLRNQVKYRRKFILAEIPKDRAAR